MKKVLVATLALGITVGMASFASAGTIVGSDHDFATQTWNSTGEICVVCHTPHNAYSFSGTGGTANKYAPLWNHDGTTATYTMYSSPTGTLDATIGAMPSTAGTVSRACLSCHDGTVALDSFGSASGTNTLTGAALVGTDLSNDHPVAFTYDDALASTDGELHVPSTTSSGLGGTINADLLFNQSLECGSCHDVHNTPGINKFLVKSNAASALCLTCHNK